jgi:hypothetical protein
VKLVRIDRLDKLDRINFYGRMHGRVVKWWNVNMTEPDMDTDTEMAGMTVADDGYDADLAAEQLLNEALSGTDSTDSTDVPPEALEIFNRLQAEAMADEAAKQAEIEEAKRKAGN